MICRIVYGDQEQEITVQNLASALSFKVSAEHTTSEASANKAASFLCLLKVANPCTLKQFCLFSEQLECFAAIWSKPNNKVLLNQWTVLLKASWPLSLIKSQTSPQCRNAFLLSPGVSKLRFPV